MSKACDLLPVLSRNLGRGHHSIPGQYRSCWHLSQTHHTVSQSWDGSASSGCYTL